MVTCTECGEQNPAGTEFCLYCHAFLAWDEAGANQPSRPNQSNGPTQRPVVRSRADQPGQRAASAAANPRPVASPAPDHLRTESVTETRMMPRITGDGLPPGADTVETPPQPAAAVEESTIDHDLFRVTSEQSGVTVPPGGEPATVVLRITNTSGIVDGYSVEAPGAPEWLITDGMQISLLPGAEDTLSVRLRVNSPTLVPAQQLAHVLRVNSLSQSPSHTDVPVTVTVPVVDAPVQLRAEPRLLRIRDTDAAEFTLLVDNAASNRTARLTLRGSDPELAVQFRFDPPTLELAPGGSGSAKVAVTAARPEPGQEMSRALTVAAVEGPRSVETLVTLQHATSVEVEDPLVGLEIVPSVLRVRDRPDAEARVVVDNTGGREWAHVRLEASDPERVVQVSWEQPILHVPPGRTAQTSMRLAARLPEAGVEASHQVTVTANDGSRRATAMATLVQAASNSPMTTLALRLEPSVLRVQDADSATGRVVVDNRRGTSGLRVFLQGSDPEGAMRITFGQPVVDIGPGQAQPVGMRLDAWRPPPGEQSTRPFSVAASDGMTAVEASGTLNQVSSRNPIELLQVKLDPSAVQLGTGRRAQLTAVLDNRAGQQPVRVSLRGDDPMNMIRFSFSPPTVDIPPGAVITAVVAVETQRPPAGQEVTRPFTVVATDGRAETAPAEGSLAQAVPARVSYARQIWRIILTLLGGLIIVFAALAMPFRDESETASEFDASEVSQVFGGPPLQLQTPTGDFFFLPAVGWLVLALAAILMFGLTGPKGKLTRLAALVTAILVVGFSIALGFFGVSVFIGTVVVIVLGCVIGYIGGLLVKR